MSGDPLALLDAAAEISITEHRPRVTEENQEKFQYLKITAEFGMEDNFPKLLFHTSNFGESCGFLRKDVEFQRNCYTGIGDHFQIRIQLSLTFSYSICQAFFLLKFHQMCKVQALALT